MFPVKCDEKSEALRNEGNLCYSDGRFFDALLKYNEGLCFAECGSANAALAYANRSAVYFELKLYERCSKNINLAKLNGYPEKKLDVLEKREEKCKEQKRVKKTERSPSDFFKLSYPVNKKVPFIVDCLEAKVSEKYGRHVITTRALKVGDVLSIESSFCAVLLNESKIHEIPARNIYQRCSNCLKDEALDLIPCPVCCKGKKWKILSWLSSVHEVSLQRCSVRKIASTKLTRGSTASSVV